MHRIGGVHMNLERVLCCHCIYTTTPNAFSSNSGRDKPEVREDASASNDLQVDPEVAK